MIDLRWQPRYVEYAQAHGNTPERQYEIDGEAYPGGRMAGFIVWCIERGYTSSRNRWQVTL